MPGLLCHVPGGQPVLFKHLFLCRTISKPGSV